MVPGTNVVYTITVTNAGPSSAEDVVVADLTPTGLTFVSNTGDCVTAFPCALGTVAAGAPPRTITATFAVPLDYTTPDPIANTASVTTTTTDPVPANNSATVETTLNRNADVAIGKSVSPVSVLVGQPTTFTVLVTNQGPARVTGLVVQDLLPAGLSLVSASPSQGSYAEATGAWTIGTLLNTESATLTLEATVTVTGAITNRALVVAQDQPDPVARNNSAAAIVNGAANADVGVNKAVDNPAPLVGEDVTFTVTVVNTGPSPATGVVVSDALPAGLTLVSATPSQGTYAAPTWTIGTLSETGPAATATLTIVATVTAPGALVNTATITQQTEVDPNAANNSASVTLNAAESANLTVTKALTRASPFVGELLTFHVIVANQGPSPATGVAVTEVLSAGLVFESAVPSQGTYDSASGVWTVGALANAGSAGLTITALVTAAGTVTNTASVAASDQPDPDPADNTSTVTVTTQTIADLAVTKTLTGPAIPGLATTYTIVVTNLGPSPVTAASVTDVLPVALVAPTWTCIADPGSSCAAASGTGNLATTVSLEAGDAATFTVTGTIAANATGLLVNMATVTAPAGAVDEDATNNTATSSVALTPSADLAITKTPSAAAVAAGTPLTWTLAVTNAGPSTATDAPVTDTFAPAFTGVTWTCTATAGSSCAAASGAGAIATTVTLLSGGGATFVATTLIASSAIGPQANTATVTAPVGTTDPQPANNSQTATVDVTASADLQITKTGPASVVPGTNVVYTITVTNAGPSDASSVVVTDGPPAGLTFVSNTGDCITAFPCALGTIPSVGPPRVITSTFTVPASYTTPDPIVNTATVSTAAGTTDPQPANNTATATVEVTASADVAITKTGPASVVPGTNVVYTITVTNAGPADAASVVVDDPAPAGLSFVSNAGDCVTAFPCALGMVPAGATRTITATFTVPASYTTPNPILNTATVATATADPVQANNSATVQTAVALRADLRVTKAGPPSAAPGAAVDYTITVTNAGASDAMAVVVEDPTPAGLTWTSNTGDCLTPFPCALGLLPPGATRTIMAAFAIPPDYTTPDPIVNTATVSSATPDAVPADNTATASTALAPAADIALAKTVDRPTAAIGEAVLFTVTATNEGPGGSTGLQILDSLPAGLSFDSAAPSQGTYDPVSGVWTTGALANGASATLTINAHVTGPAPIVNMAVRLVSDQVDPDSGNDAASAVITPLPVADVRILKTADRTVVPVGEVVTFIVSAVNAGPSDATGVRIIDLLPAGLAFVSAAPSAGTYDPSTGTWTLGTLATGGTATLQIVATVADAGAHTNVAQRTAQNEMDPVPLNDMSGVTVNGPSADLQVLKTVSTREPGVATVGERIRFTVSVTNRGPDDATNVRILDMLPPGLIFAGAVASQGTYTPGAGVWDVGALAASGAASLATLTVDADVAEPVALVNTAARLGADQVDPNRLNDQRHGHDHGRGRRPPARADVRRQPGSGGRCPRLRRRVHEHRGRRRERSHHRDVLDSGRNRFRECVRGMDVHGAGPGGVVRPRRSGRGAGRRRCRCASARACSRRSSDGGCRRASRMRSTPTPRTTPPQSR